MGRVPVSIFVGDIRPLPESGRPTGMYKTALGAATALGTEGFAGDHQADRRVHGGPDKALHLFPQAHLATLAQRFPQAAAELVPGAIGENLSAPLLEHDVRVGDVWRLGDAHIQVCQPRSPCWKIDERFGCIGMAAFIVEARITGWYWRVLRPGQVRPGDPLECLSRADAPTLREALAQWYADTPSIDALRQLAAMPGIAANWRRKIEQRLDWLARQAQV